MQDASKQTSTAGRVASQEPYRYSYTYGTTRQRAAVPLRREPVPARKLPEIAGGKRTIVAGAGLLGLVLLVIVGLSMSHGGALPDEKATAATTTKSTKVTTNYNLGRTPVPVNDQAMLKSIKDTIAQYPSLEISVSLVSVADGKTAQVGTDDAFVAGSIGKLMTAALYLHDAETGKVTLNQSINGHSAQYQLQQMVEVSDNTAWTSLNGILGHSQLKSYARSLDLDTYGPTDNTISTSDISQLLYKLYTGKLLNSGNSKILLDSMQDANYSQYIMAGVPSGVKAYHKVGYLDERLNDTAIIDNGKNAYVLSIFSKTKDDSDYDFAAGQRLFQAITKTTASTLLK